MVLIIGATLLLLGLAFYQVVQGMFSAIIMAILSVLCAAVALNFYEPLAGVFNRSIRGNVVMGMGANRIGGAVFGLISSFALIGVLMIVLQLLPLPGTILTYKPYNATLQVHHG